MSQTKVKLTCEECSKLLSSKQSLASHMKSFHDGFQGLKKMFSTPRVAAKPKKLFTGDEAPATQGNSKGQVNDPKVVSEAVFSVVPVKAIIQIVRN